jgi:hypothetical protein
MPLRNAPSATLANLATVSERLSGRVAALDVADVPGLQQRLEAAVLEQGTATTFGIRPKPLQWVDTGIHLTHGESVTLIGSGALHLMRALKVSLLPKAVIWWRVGDSDVQAAPGESWTFTAERDGALQLAALPPGSFADRRGQIERSPMHALMSGALQIAVIRWTGDVSAGLRAAAERDGALFGAALRRHLNPIQPPQGWHYLWRLGDGELYTAEDDGTLVSQTDCDVGILQFPVDCPLTADLRLQWSWNAAQLPSRRAEHIDLTHDYLSIAVEFDNGLDLTFMWSAALKPGTVFQCPLPWWSARETHWVLRALPDDPLGEWLDEDQPLLTCYQTAIGGPAPKRVVAVWLIANSIFQRQPGACRYRNLRLTAGNTVTTVPVRPAI